MLVPQPRQINNIRRERVVPKNNIRRGRDLPLSLSLSSGGVFTQAAEHARRAWTPTSQRVHTRHEQDVKGDSKRLHVEDMRACCRYTRRRPDRTHGGVLNVHTGVFSACQASPHTTPHHTTRTTTPHAHTDTTHTTHNTTCTHTKPTPHNHMYTQHTTPHVHTHKKKQHTTHTTAYTYAQPSQRTHAHHTTPKRNTTHFLFKTVTTVTSVTSVILMRIYCFRLIINL